MRYRLTLLLTLAFTCGPFLTSTRVARACGGGLVHAQTGSVGADAQRIIISARDGTTDVITQIGVPPTTPHYGGLLPLPGEATRACGARGPGRRPSTARRSHRPTSTIWREARHRRSRTSTTTRAGSPCPIAAAAVRARAPRRGAATRKGASAS